MVQSRHQCLMFYNLLSALSFSNNFIMSRNRTVSFLASSGVVFTGKLFVIVLCKVSISIV